MQGVQEKGAPCGPALDTPAAWQLPHLDLPASHPAGSGLELVGNDVVALLDGLADDAGDDLGLIAGDTAVSELPSHGKCVEHEVQRSTRRGQRSCAPHQGTHGLRPPQTARSSWRDL